MGFGLSGNIPSLFLRFNTIVRLKIGAVLAKCHTCPLGGRASAVNLASPDVALAGGRVEELAPVEAGREFNLRSWRMSHRVNRSRLGESFDCFSPHRYQFLLVFCQPVHAETDPVNNVAVNVAV